MPEAKPEPTAQSSSGSRPGLLSTVGLWLGTVLCAYVLSTGPVAKIETALTPPGSPQRASAEKALNTFYAPIIWVDNHAKAFDKFLRWYVLTMWRVQ